MSVPNKVFNAHLKTIRGIVVKGFAKVDKKFDGIDKRFDDMESNLNRLDKKVDDTRLELKSDIEKVQMSLEEDIDDLAGMTAREFQSVRSEIAHRNLLQSV